MDQRMFLAVGLSMLVILGFYLIVPHFQPPHAPVKVTESKDKAPATAAEKAPAGPEEAKLPPPMIAAPAVSAHVIHVETPLYTATVDTRGGRMVSLVLKNYKVTKDTLDWGDLIPYLRQWIHKPELDPNANVQMVKQVANGQVPMDLVFMDDPALTQSFKSVVYRAGTDDLKIAAGRAPATLTLTGTGPDGLTVRKEVTFNADSYVIGYDLAVINYGKAPHPLHIISDFGLGPDTDHARVTRGHYGPMYRQDGKIKKKNAEDVKGGVRLGSYQWLAMNDTYFIAAASSETPSTHAIYKEVPGAKEGKDGKYPVVGMGIELPQVTLEPQKMIDGKFKLYLGPKQTDEMLKFGGKLHESLDLTLDFIASPMLAMLRWFYSFTHNYGVAIILLTIVVRVLLFPLTYKGMVSMKRMAKLQPRMTAMRERHKGDKERMNKEMMEMYRKYKINPLSGCLPIAFQIPVFFALYSALLGAIELRHSPFVFWLTDLSAHDGLYVLPLFMGVSMFFQQRLTPTSMDPTQAKIMMWMPVVFTFFMLNFPAGLTLYWLTSNLLSIAQQLIINRVQVPEFAD